MIFGAVVTERSREDLHLLEASVKTLESAAAFSKGITKLHDACNTFLKLARGHLSSTSQADESWHNDMQYPSATDTFDPTALSQHDWDAMFDNWDLGLGGEDARSLSHVFTGGFPWQGVQ